MEAKKRVYCLYRVSTLGQVEKDDIPMQKQSCREFAERQGWEIIKEFSEKGVSGFKVSSKDRDAIQEIQKDAMAGKLDILLVFMFDRIGRKEDETPFVVEWFVRNGVAVWSVNEGEQRFDSHVDKLMNYIRYWQASGESIKTSIRTKTRLGQIVQEGRYKGGFVLYGYRIEKCGRLNKKNNPVNDLRIDEYEADVVRKIFDKYINEGYGTYRLCRYLRECGIKNRKGEGFTNTTILHMIQNDAYTGVLHSGDTISEIFPDLQIIPPEIFKKARAIARKRMIDRERRIDDDTIIPFSTKGRSLLSGNIFCGHCGGKLTADYAPRTYIRKGGMDKVIARSRYVCYNRVRHVDKCDGQSTYAAKVIDGIVDEQLHVIFDMIKETPQNEMLTRLNNALLSEAESALKIARQNLTKKEKELADLKGEIIKVIRGQSGFSADLLNEVITQTEDSIKAAQDEVARCQNVFGEAQSDADAQKAQVDEIITWSNLYDNAVHETKKMIASQLIEAVRVYKDHRLEIDFNISLSQLLDTDCCDVSDFEHWLQPTQQTLKQKKELQVCTNLKLNG